MRLRRWCLAFAVALISMLSFVQSGNADTVCTFYPNSSPRDLGSYGPGCFGVGPGCNECVTTVSRGAKVCYWDPFFYDIYCYYTGEYPENQI